jgi:hypothetical protein
MFYSLLILINLSFLRSITISRSTPIRACFNVLSGPPPAHALILGSFQSSQPTCHHAHDILRMLQPSSIVIMAYLSRTTSSFNINLLTLSSAVQSLSFTILTYAVSLYHQPRSSLSSAWCSQRRFPRISAIFACLPILLFFFYFHMPP